jgi:uncharacterized protein (TIGR02466 family)
MIQDLWFPTPVWRTFVDFDLAPLEKFCRRIKKKHPEGVVVSNAGGWQSPLIFKKDYLDAKVFEQYVDTQLLDISDDLNLTHPLKLISFWINFNKKNNYNTTHIHTQCALSGIIYLKIDKNNGYVVFENNSMERFVRETMWSNKGENFLTSSTMTYKPEKGSMIFFPPWIQHHVLENTSGTERISIAFNISY